MREWISIQDKEPDVNVCTKISPLLLCYTDKGNVALSRYYKSSDGTSWFSCEKNEPEHDYLGRVIYWTLIPDLPTVQ